MKILHVAETIIGGIASHLDEIMGAQIDRWGADNVAALVPDDQIQYLTAPSAESIYSFVAGKRGMRSSFRLVRATRALARRLRPDIVHLHSSIAGGLVRGSYLLSPTRPAIVYCPHGWAFAREISEGRKALLALAERTLTTRTEAIITVSRHERDLALGRGFPREKLVVIENGIAVEQPSVANPIIYPRRALNLLFVGRLDRQKGIDLLLDAAAATQDMDIHFHIIGAQVIDQVQRVLPDLPNVTYYGWRSRPEVMAHMLAADALLAPSRWEGMPITVIEAMRFGKPVIAGGRSSLPELIVDGVTGHLIDVTDAGELIRKVRSLDPEALKHMGAAARERFLQHFTAARQANAIVNLYEGLVAPATPPISASETRRGVDREAGAFHDG